jgi:hypothetical protein
MRIRTLAGTLAVSGLLAASLPAPAEAAHRHSRSCGHGGYSSRSYRADRSHRSYRAPRYSYGYRDRYYGRSYYAPRYRYRPYRYTRYVPYYEPYYEPYGYYGPYAYNGPYPAYRPVRGHYHGRAWCVRPHVSVHIGF